MYELCTCQDARGLGTVWEIPLDLIIDLNGLFKLLAKRAHRNLWKRCLWGCWSLAENWKKAECWQINIRNYRNFLQTNACVSFFLVVMVITSLQSEEIRKLHMGNLPIILKREKLWIHLEISCSKVICHTISGWCPPTLSPDSPQIWRQSPWSLWMPNTLISNRISELSSISGFPL